MKTAEAPQLRSELAHLDGTTLRLSARGLAEGVHGGVHRAERKGSGIEFAGHRPYTPGDDLRHLDRHALLRHGRLMIREFHTDTDRAVHLIVDATPSMAYRSDAELWDRATGKRHSGLLGERPTKLGRSALLAAAIALIARRAGDAVGLSMVSPPGALPRNVTTLRPRHGGETSEHLLSLLGDALSSPPAAATSLPAAERAPSQTPAWSRVLSEAAAVLPRGALVFVFSDFLDFDATNLTQLTDLATRRRELCCVQVLDPAEISFPFTGPLRLRDPETSLEVETDAESARRTYLESLSRMNQRLKDALLNQGARFVPSSTEAAARDVLRKALLPT